MAKKQSLGRGLDSLFSDNTEENSGSIMMLRVAEIEPNPTQPRKHFDPEALAQLADSIAMHGLLQPIAVRESMGGFYQIIAGERRWRAAKMAGLIEIPAILYEMDDKKAAELALVENLQREDLNPIEEALAFRSLIKDYGVTQEEAAKRIGRSRSAVANSLRLLDMPEAVINMVADGRITAGHARAVLSLTRESDMTPFAERIFEKQLSVRDAEAEAKAINLRAMQEEIGLKDPEPLDESPIYKNYKSYFRRIERRASEALGRRFRIIDAGENKPKKIEITCSGNEDIESILKRLCGEDFFDQQ